MKIHIVKNAVFCQAKNYWLCLHIGGTALFFGYKWMAYAHRLEICTPDTWFRFTLGVRNKTP